MAAAAAPPPAPAVGFESRVRGALWGCLSGDALSMPVHWYYALPQLRRDFGRAGITKYEAPVENFPGSIMALSNTGGAGRGSNDGDIIGTVINHGKKKYWARGGNFHYHHGLRPGENTLEAQLFRLTVRALTASDGVVDVASMRDAYVQFMTTPGSHNDTYASTCHRMFFKNRADGLPLEQCPDNDDHNVDTMDGLVMTIPAILAHAAEGGANGESCSADTAAAVRAVVSVTRDSRSVGEYAQVLAQVLHEVLAAPAGADAAATLRAALERAALEHLSLNLKRAITLSRGDPMTSWYLSSAFPALLHFAHKYAEDPAAALLASANAGGENVHRSCVLGALLGAAHGDNGLAPWLAEGLTARAEIEAEATAFAAMVAAKRGGTDGTAAASL